MKSKYAVAVDYDGLGDPGNVSLVGWSNREDYYDNGMTVYDILGEEPDGGLIDAGYGVCVYADTDLDNIKDVAKRAGKEGYEVTVVRIDETDDEFDVVPVL